MQFVPISMRLHPCRPAPAPPGIRHGAAVRWVGKCVGMDGHGIPSFSGLCADPYEDYSRPWFGTHRVLRGASFATKPRLARLAYRNFYTPDRCDVFLRFSHLRP